MVLLFLLLPFILKPENKSGKVLIPTTYLDSLWYYGDIYEKKYGVDKRLMVSVAIAEQGWSLKKNQNYRIFNITGGKNYVWDNGEQQFRNYRNYTGIDAACEDFCKLIASSYIKPEDSTLELQTKRLKKYASAKNYVDFLKAIQKSEKMYKTNFKTISWR